MLLWYPVYIQLDDIDWEVWYHVESDTFSVPLPTLNPKGKTTESVRFKTLGEIIRLIMSRKEEADWSLYDKYNHGKSVYKYKAGEKRRGRPPNKPKENLL